MAENKLNALTAAVYFPVLALFLFACQPEKQKEETPSADKGQYLTSSEKQETKKREMKREPAVKIQTPQEGEFFKGGYETKNGKKCGIYVVVAGDSVWVIAEKYAVHIYGSNYTKKETGNIAVKINFLNYDNLFAGVNDELKIGDRVFVELEN